MTASGIVSAPAARSRRLAAAACGLAAAAWALLVPLLGGHASAPYSHVSQFISELGATGAVHGPLVAAAGFAPIGALSLAFVVLAYPSLPASRRTRAGAVCVGAVGAAYLVAAVSPCDPGCPESGSPAQAIHNLFGLLEYVGAFGGLLLLAAAFRASAAWGSAVPASIAAAAGGTLGFAAMLAPQLAPMRGIGQRVAEASIFIWIAYISIRLLRLRSRSARGFENASPEGDGGGGRGSPRGALTDATGSDYSPPIAGGGKPPRPGGAIEMRVVAVAVLTLLLAATAGAEDPPPHAPKPGIAQPKIDEGWAVLVCSVFSTASSISISAGPDNKSLEPIGEWTSENRATKWVFPAKIAEGEKISVQLKAVPADQKASACLMYRRVPRHAFDFSGEAAAFATQNDPFVRCPCARGHSLDEKR